MASKSWRAAANRAVGLLGVATILTPVAWARSQPAAPRQEIQHAVERAKAGHLDAAFLLAERAAAAAPDNHEYATVREMLRQRAALGHLERAHALQRAHQPDAAAVEYQLALSIAPGNADAHAGLAALFPAPRAPAMADATELRVRRASSPARLDPTPGVRDFHLREGVRQAVGDIARAYGLKAYVADSVPEHVLRIDLGQASFADAMAALRATAGVGYIPVDAHTLYFIETSRLDRLQPLATRTFYLPAASGAQSLTQVEGILKNLLGVKEITPDAAASALSLRATPAQLDVAEQLLLDLGQPPGEVVLQIKLLSLSATASRSLGLSEPNQFTMFALGPLLKQLQQSGGLSQDILTLFQQGGLDAVLNSGALNSSLLAQAQSQLSPLLQNPFVTFGGGATLMAISVPDLAAQLTSTEGRTTSVETALLRARSGQAAEMKIGQRYPVINASFSPISLSPAISKDIANGGFIEPFPSFTYEDLGLDAKVTPIVSAGGAINLRLDLSVKALTGQSNNDIPILTDRHVVTGFRLENNEPLLVAGLFTRQEMSTLSGLPGLSQIPGFGRLFSIPSRQSTGDQLALEITAHVVHLPPRGGAAIGLPASFAAAGNVPAPEPGPRLVPLHAGYPPAAPEPGPPRPPDVSLPTPGMAPPSRLFRPNPPSAAPSPAATEPIYTPVPSK